MGPRQRCEALKQESPLCAGFLAGFKRSLWDQGRPAVLALARVVAHQLPTIGASNMRLGRDLLARFIYSRGGDALLWKHQNQDQPDQR
jgi:hypothetical protein